MSDECLSKWFSYNGSSTKDILNNCRLILGSFNGEIDSVDGTVRTVTRGEQTITRPIPNEYGVISDLTKFEYSLLKSDFAPFTISEQIAVERWLTSPKTSRELVLFDANGEMCRYCGLFVSTSWIPHGSGYIGLNFSFEANAPYPYKKYTKEYNVEGSLTVDLLCESDELEEYTYPTIVINSRESGTITICNTSDSNNSMDVNINRSVPTTFDCQRCIAFDDLGIITYKKLGWEDVGNIYWLRLLAGKNIISLKGNFTITFIYNAPYKIVGGWL